MLVKFFYEKEEESIFAEFFIAPTYLEVCSFLFRLLFIRLLLVPSTHYLFTPVLSTLLLLFFSIIIQKPSKENNRSLVSFEEL